MIKNLVQNYVTYAVSYHLGILNKWTVKLYDDSHNFFEQKLFPFQSEMISLQGWPSMFVKKTTECVTDLD